MRASALRVGCQEKVMAVVAYADDLAHQLTVHSLRFGSGRTQ